MNAQRRRQTGSGESGMVRAFFAFEIPAACRQEIDRHLCLLRSSLPPAKWVRAEGLHLTLKFLGDADHQVLSTLVSELTAPLSALPEVTVRLAGCGVFPNRSRARVAWIGGSAAGAAEVARSIEAVAERHGFQRERRPWALHLTLARLRQPWPVTAVDELIARGEQLLLPPFQCREVVLLSSQLKPSGAVYTALRRARFAGSPGNGAGSAGNGGSE